MKTNFAKFRQRQIHLKDQSFMNAARLFLVASKTKWKARPNFGLRLAKHVDCLSAIEVQN